MHTPMYHGINRLLHLIPIAMPFLMSIDFPLGFSLLSCCTPLVCGESLTGVPVVQGSQLPAGIEFAGEYLIQQGTANA